MADSPSSRAREARETSMVFYWQPSAAWPIAVANNPSFLAVPPSFAAGAPAGLAAPFVRLCSLGAPRANVGAVVAPFTAPSAIQRRSSGGRQTTPRCSARCFARHMRSSVSASTSAASSIRRSTSARRSSRAGLGSAASSGGAWSMRPPLRLPSARQSSAFRDSSRRLSGSRTHATVEPSTVTGQREAASLSRRARSKFSESHCERPRRTVRTSEPVLIRSPRAFAGGSACGAIFESAQCGRPNVERNPERRELLGVLHFWQNDAGMRDVIEGAGCSPSCARRTREAASRWSRASPRAFSAGSSPGESGSHGAGRFTQRPVV